VYQQAVTYATDSHVTISLFQQNLYKKKYVLFPPRMEAPYRMRTTAPSARGHEDEMSHPPRHHGNTQILYQDSSNDLGVGVN
jgi:hypothetical protein